MNRVGIKRSVFSFIIIITCMLGVLYKPITVQAGREDVDSVTYIAENVPEVLSICSRANAVVGKEILVYTGNDGLLSFSNKTYTALTVDERRDFMESALLMTKESGLGSQIKNKVYNFIAEQDSTTSASVKLLRSDASTDFVKAAAIFKPFGSIVGVILGVLSLFIFMFIGLSILFDVAYLVLPGFKMVLEKGENKRPRWVSREAYASAKDSEESINSSEGFKGSMTLYFKRRIPSIVLMSVALGYLISGQIYDLIVFFIDSFSWIFEQG